MTPYLKICHKHPHTIVDRDKPRTPGQVDQEAMFAPQGSPPHMQGPPLKCCHAHPPQPQITRSGTGWDLILNSMHLDFQMHFCLNS